MSQNHRRPGHSPPKHQQGGPSAKLREFLNETLARVESGEIGRQTGADLIKSWPTLRADEIALKAKALRELAILRHGPSPA